MTTLTFHKRGTASLWGNKRGGGSLSSGYTTEHTVQVETPQIQVLGSKFDIHAPDIQVTPSTPPVYFLPSLKLSSSSKNEIKPPFLEFNSPQKEKTNPLIKISPIEEIGQDRPIKQDTPTKTNTVIDSVLKTFSSTKSKSKERIIQEQEIIQKPATIQESIFDQTPTQQPTPTPPIGINIQTPKPEIPINILPSGFYIPGEKKTKTRRGFNVFVKSKGEFKKVNTKTLTKEDALGLGTYKVGTSASASFKLVESGRVTGTNKARGNIKDFYKKKDTYIEKRGRRIKSFGELKEITFKGIASNKGKKKGKKKKGIFGGLF